MRKKHLSNSPTEKKKDYIVISFLFFWLNDKISVSRESASSGS